LLVPQDLLLLEQVAFIDRARRQRRVGDGSTVDDGFRYEGFADDAATYRVLAASVAGMLPGIETLLATSEAGPHVSPCGVSSA